MDPGMFPYKRLSITGWHRLSSMPSLALHRGFGGLPDDLRIMRIALVEEFAASSFTAIIICPMSSGPFRTQR